MRKADFIGLIMFMMLLVSCTLEDSLSGVHYKTDDRFRIHRFGFTELDNQSHLNKLNINTGDLFDSCMMHSFGRCDFDTIKLLNIVADYDSIKTDSIKAICQRNNIDGLLLTKLGTLTLKEESSKLIIRRTNYVNGNALLMEMILFDNTGKTLVELSLVKRLDGIESYEQYHHFISNVIQSTVNSMVDEIQSARVYRP